MHIKACQAFFWAALILLLGTHTAHAEEPIKIGMSAAFTGPASPLGNGMRAGIEAAFKESNAKSGVHGRDLELVALDDGYEPSRTAPNMHTLIEQGVFAVLGNVGTPTAAVSVPIAQKKKVPFWGAYTGAGLLRKTPPERYIFNYRASYAEETAQIIAGLLDQMKISPDKIGFFTQNDAYGDSGYLGAIKALQERGYARAERLVHGRYVRNTLDVEGAVADFLDPRNRPEVVIMVGTAPPCAKMIRLARQYGLRTTFIGVSFIGAEALLTKLGPKLAEGVVISQVVPDPETSQLEAARAFRSLVPREKRSYTSFEGFVAARSMIAALQAAPAKASREQVIETLEAGTPLKFGLGKPYKLSSQDHQLSHKLWASVLRKGKVKPLKSWAELRKTKRRGSSYVRR